jgi:hypothetical protein
MTSTNTQRIRKLNDRFRQTGHGGEIYLKDNITTLPGYGMLDVIAAVRAFDAFENPEDDHSTGTLDVAGVRVIWTIDYYKPNIDGELDLHGERSADPANPKKTIRVLYIRRDWGF